VTIANDREGNGAASTRFAAVAVAGAEVLVTLAGATLTMRDGHATDAAIATVSAAETTAALAISRGAAICAGMLARRSSRLRELLPAALVATTNQDHGRTTMSVKSVAPMEAADLTTRPMCGSMRRA
jgi:hypothetical protein